MQWRATPIINAQAATFKKSVGVDEIIAAHRICELING